MIDRSSEHHQITGRHFLFTAEKFLRFRRLVEPILQDEFICRRGSRTFTERRPNDIRIAAATDGAAVNDP